MSAPDNESIPLGDINFTQSIGSFRSSQEIEQPSLAPADGGKAAWLMLASCCLVQLPVWGKMP